MPDPIEVVVDEVTSPTTAQPAETKTVSAEDEVEIVVEGEEPLVVTKTTEGEEPDELTKLQTDATELQRKLQEAEQRELRLAQDLQNARRTTAPAVEEKPTKVNEEKISHTQLVAIIKEHGSDPEIMANVISHMAKQEALSIRDKTVEDIDQRTWHQNLSSIEGRAIAEDPVLSKRPDIVDKLPAMAAALKLDKHPFGRYLSFLAYRAGNEITTDVATDAAEATRVADLEKKKGIDKTKTLGKKSITMTKEQSDIAKRFGVSPQLYAKFIPNKEAS